MAIVGATVDLLDRNTTTPVRATTTTDASGYWAISHATEGRFDVRVTNVSSVRWHKYDASLQLETIEAAVLRLRNPADTFDYDVVAGAITADRQLNLPVLTGTDTVAVTDLAQTLSAKTLSAPTITASDWANANHAHTSAATGGTVSSAVTREGGNTTEATTTSTSLVDLLTASSLTVAVSEPVLAVASLRKSGGAANQSRAGVKLNTTAVAADNNWANGTDEAQSGHWSAKFTYGLTSYLNAGVCHVVGPNGAGLFTRFATSMPTATLTTVVVTALSNDALITTAADNLHVYSYAVS